MTYLAAIQEVADDGAIRALPGAPDVVEITNDDLYELMEQVADVLVAHPDVHDFDLTVTNQDLEGSM